MEATSTDTTTAAIFAGGKLSDTVTVEASTLVIAAALIVGRLLRHRPAAFRRLLWIGGAAGWLVSQLLEAAQWVEGDVKAESYDLLMVSEEVLEMTGSALFLLALYRCLRSAKARVWRDSDGACRGAVKARCPNRRGVLRAGSRSARTPHR